jgi:hypothetical protein
MEESNETIALSNLGGDRRITIRVIPTSEYAARYGNDFEIDIIAGPLAGTVTHSWLYTHLEKFDEQLGALHENLSGSAMLGSREEDAYLKFWGDGKGGVGVDVQLTPLRYPPVKLEFSFAIDQSYIPEFRRIIRRYFLVPNVRD